MRQTHAVACAAALFSRLGDEDYARATTGELWRQVARTLGVRARPPKGGAYRAFANRVLTAGIPGSAVPVESFYVKWSELPGVEGGLGGRRYLSDRALHVRALCDELGVGIPKEFQAMPDHLSLLCELWAFLDANAPARDAEAFARDHLEWIAAYREELEGRAARDEDGRLEEAYAFYLDLAFAIEEAVRSTTKEGEQSETR